MAKPSVVAGVIPPIGLSFNCLSVAMAILAIVAGALIVGGR